MALREPKSDLPRQPSTTGRRIAVVVYPGAPLLDVTNTLEVFARANQRFIAMASRPPYAVDLVGPAKGPVATSIGVPIVASHGVGEADGPYDTLLLAGGESIHLAARDMPLRDWIRRMAAGSRRVGAICRGVFALAESGVLAGRRATTHWAWCAELAARYPDIAVEPEPVFVRDGSIYTSAGVSAALDLALAFVEDDHGRQLALELARELVLYVQRSAGQPQISALLSTQLATRSPIRALQAWILENLDEDLSVPTLARRMGMSPRNFSRVFAREVGRTPRQFVEKVRIEAARRLLEETEYGIDAVAARVGFTNTSTLRREFSGELGISPRNYRRNTQH
ncbi:GlxA family transcriptional regulator [Pendulispora albinea]|uniref:GlxA family transcriptional regulator n=1 Tax=Pendulispora albinea TaxID=2741071 RepID=A0ABZ2LZ62_9BACT